MKNKEWDAFIRETYKPQFEFIIKEINHLFEIEKNKTLSKKNVELIRIYLPEKVFTTLEETIPSFKTSPNLGGIPCMNSKREKITIDIEIVDPRKRKKKAIVYVKNTE